jgi:transposase
MAIAGESREQVAVKFAVLFPHLDERQQRLLMGAEARILGHGGVRVVARAAGKSEATVRKGVDELEAGGAPLGRVRRRGGGRKKAADVDSGLRPALLALVEPDMRGDPMSPMRWTVKSTRRLADELTRQGHRVCADTVGDLLREEGFSLQANAKTLEGRQHPDRDTQFRYINEQAKAYQDTGDPVISVDTKKKELVGPFRNPGRQWRPKGAPEQVSTHDFPDRQLGKVVPYGIYDVAANTGWVNVGIDHDTAAFAVESMRRWWNGAGRAAYPRARRLLVTADAGGSNGYRPRAWKAQLAALAAETGLAITVCHVPPGTSKWNRIEHCLFSHITMNWRGRPLTSHEVVVQSIAATTTRTGLTVHAELDSGSYPTGTQVTDAEMATLPIIRHDFHGDWNYTLHPPPHSAANAQDVSVGTVDSVAVADRATAYHPALTGMSHQALAQLTATLTDAWSDQREARRHHRRGGQRRHAPGGGGVDKLELADRVVAALLHQRFNASSVLIGQLLGVNRITAARAVKEILPLLQQHGHLGPPRPIARIHTVGDAKAHIATGRRPVPEAAPTVPPQRPPQPKTACC